MAVFLICYLRFIDEPANAEEKYFLFLHPLFSVPLKQLQLSCTSNKQRSTSGTGNCLIICLPTCSLLFFAGW